MIESYYFIILLLLYTVTLIAGLRSHSAESFFGVSSLIFCALFVWMLVYQWYITPNIEDAFASTDEIRDKFHNQFVITYFLRTKGYIVGTAYFYLCLLITRVIFPKP